MQTISLDELKSIHEALTVEFIELSDPISPPGIKDEHLLNSAIDRQHVSFGNTMKYDDPYSSAATLAYGICMNHAFHNGNKRAAVVAMLAHLDKNGYRFTDTSSDDLYEVFVKFTDHQIHQIAEVKKMVVSDRQSVDTSKKFLIKTTLSKALEVKKLDNPDLEVHCLATWIRKKTRNIANYDKEITVRELKRILFKFELILEPSSGLNYIIRKTRMVTPRRNVLNIFKSLSPSPLTEEIYRFKLPNDGRKVGVTLVKMIRKNCQLCEIDGIDATAFYGDEPGIDFIIANYSNLLRRLAKT